MKGTMILTAGLVAAMTLVGCGANNPAGPGATKVTTGPNIPGDTGGTLLGVWRMQTGDALIAFKNGGEVDVIEASFPEDPLTISGAYQVDGDKVVLKANAVEGQEDAAVARALGRFTTYTYAIDGKVLTLKKADGEAVRWEKV